MRWPRRDRLVQQLRDVLRREFGCQDAWVVIGPGRCRLDVRVAGRHLTLLDASEERFWPLFYVAAHRERLHMGERLVEVHPLRKSRAELTEALAPFWVRVMGHPPRR